MNDPLAPQPMTSAQIADLVERTRAMQRSPSMRAANGEMPLGRRGALLARERGIHIRVAAAEVGCAEATVGSAWRLLFGDDPWPCQRAARGVAG